MVKKGQQSMSSSCNFLLLTIFILAFLSIAFGEQSCSETFIRLIQKRNITNCKTLRTQGAEFAWNYHYNGTNSTILDILFGARLNSPEGWIAWGVNPGKRAEMIGTKAIIGIKYSDGSLIVNTYDITKETKHGCKLLPSPIGLEVSNKSMENDAVSEFYTISARIILPKEYNITRLNHVWQLGYAIADGNQPLRHPTTLHNVDSTETINLTSSSGNSTGQYRSYLRSVHGVLNMMGWGTMLPIGVIIARYFRVYPFKFHPMWFYLHISCQVCGFLTGTAGWIIGLYLGHATRYYTFHTHRTFGILIFTLSTVQMLAFRLKPKQTDDYRKYWNMYHHFLGYGLITIIVINIFKGISIMQGGKGWKWTYFGILIILGSVTITLEIATWARFILSKLEKQKNNKGDNNKTPTS
ncbi:hypothetical protein Lal_00036094 [Lupinus albus]|uniref:Cytochrome b561 and DOMON domain-containing protein n=1 Tax=Lupinus albus TaxID=3870 RepID=A0A6A5M4C7_LUPAL|nr:putative cytochrome b561 and DOMON domain-containing protein [Lupinus albus]KAF1868656.1 hypothetical protein Lal_00036094 [Lupinus albus]